MRITKRQWIRKTRWGKFHLAGGREWKIRHCYSRRVDFFFFLPKATRFFCKTLLRGIVRGARLSAEKNNLRHIRIWSKKIHLAKTWRTPRQITLLMEQYVARDAIYKTKSLSPGRCCARVRTVSITFRADRSVCDFMRLCTVLHWKILMAKSFHGRRLRAS